MEGGSPAPAGIFIEAADGYSVLDGVQRLVAGELIGLTTFAGYVIDPKTSLVNQRKIRIFANKWLCGDHCPTDAESLAAGVQFLYFMDKCSPEEIAKIAVRKLADVYAEIAFQTTTKKMEQVGYSGKYSERGKKWFVVKCGQRAMDDDWVRAPVPIREWLELMEECKFNNGDADTHIDDFWGIKRTPKADRQSQFVKKLAEQINDPDVRMRLDSTNRRLPVTNIVTKLKSASTTIDAAKKSNLVLSDGGIVYSIHRLVKKIQADLTAMVPKGLTDKDGTRLEI